MQNKVYFTEIKPGILKRNSTFKLSSIFEADTQNREAEAFGWRLKIKEVIKFKIKIKAGQILSSKEKRHPETYSC